ncbi:MAG: hypothetical protein Q7J09_08755 [Methanocalculus sp.]|nr:hypothetical protein [Methanocalculus sp.]MDO9540076.1 hypothetical protein [Methanocalculus sp.]
MDSLASENDASLIVCGLMNSMSDPEGTICIDGSRVYSSDNPFS